MHQSKLVETLELLSKKEWSLLKDFVFSPTHNQHEGVKLLFQYLDSHFNNWNNDTLEDIKVYQSIFKNQPFKKAQLRHVASYLLQVTEAFLGYQEWQNDGFENQMAIVRAYQKRKSTKPVISKLDKISKQINLQPFRNANYYQNRYEIELENYYLIEQKTRKAEFNLKSVSDNLDIAYIVEKLRRSCTELTHQAVYKADYDRRFLDLILNYLPNSQWLNIPAIAIYYHSYLALSDANDVHHFLQMKTLIKTHNALFPKDELKDIVVLAINYCIRQINSGNQTFEKELLDLYKNGLETAVFIENNVLSRWTYKNIVSIGLGVKEFEWIDYFIHHYKDYIDEKHRDNTFKYNLAKLNYRKKEYNQAMTLLFNITEKDLLLLLDAKRLLCKIYYESTEWKALDSHLHSFELYVRRQKAIGYHKENYLNFIKCLKKLLKLNFYEKEEIQKLYQTIQNYKVLPEKRWLLAQLSDK